MMTAEKRQSRSEDSARRLASDLVTVLEGLATSRLDGDLLKQQAITAHHMGRRRLSAILSEDADSGAVDRDRIPRARLAAVLRQAGREISAGHFEGSAADILRALCREFGLSHLDVVDGGLR